MPRQAARGSGARPTARRKAWPCGHTRGFGARPRARQTGARPRARQMAWLRYAHWSQDVSPSE
eukprot:7376093-Prymnesium_polylepis.1